MNKTITGSIYFLGSYRPAYFEADSVPAVKRKMLIAKRPHDPFLDRVTANMPHYPGLDYSSACNI